MGGEALEVVRGCEEKEVRRRKMRSVVRGCEWRLERQKPERVRLK